LNLLSPIIFRTLDKSIAAGRTIVEARPFGSIGSRQKLAASLDAFYATAGKTKGTGNSNHAVVPLLDAFTHLIINASLLSKKPYVNPLFPLIEALPGGGSQLVEHQITLAPNTLIVTDVATDTRVASIQTPHVQYHFDCEKNNKIT
jgi:hypothetical protein